MLYKMQLAHVSWVDLLKINKIKLTGASQKPGEPEVQNGVHRAVYKMPISVEQWEEILTGSPVYVSAHMQTVRDKT